MVLQTILAKRRPRAALFYSCFFLKSNAYIDKILVRTDIYCIYRKGNGLMQMAGGISALCNLY